MANYYDQAKVPKQPTKNREGPPFVSMQTVGSKTGRLKKERIKLFKLHCQTAKHLVLRVSVLQRVLFLFEKAPKGAEGPAGRRGKV